MVVQDQNPGFPDTKKKKVRRTHEHASGVIIPRWWRGNVAILVGVLAVASVFFAALTLEQASERVAEQQKAVSDESEQSVPAVDSKVWRKTQEQAPYLPQDAVAQLFPDPEEISETVAEESMDDGPVRAYEEPLPGDLYEEAPVIPDATGPRVIIQEEYIPDPGDGTAATAPGPRRTDDQADDAAASRTVAETPDPLSRLSDSVAPDTGPDIDIKPFERKLLEQQQAWLTNALPFSADNIDLPMIAIVIDDMGVDRKRSRRAITLPGPLTLSFMTYAHDLDAQTQAALDAGHELMIHIPMEPDSSTVDPGPNVLRVEDSTEQTLKRLRWGLAQFDGYVGLNNHMGSKFTQDSTGVRAVLEEVKDRGLLFLDSRTAGNSVAAELAREIGIPFATRNVFLDHIAEEDEVRLRLAQTERLARKNGAVVAIGHPHDATLNVLAEWLPTVAGKGLMLVPMSALVRRTWLQEQ